MLCYFAGLLFLLETENIFTGRKNKRRCGALINKELDWINKSYTLNYSG